jgi:ArsR family transcriptional regulator, arsenate/arsenite/antimonite-responsive transcriptional repressor / arsenate reductase (thioredoxin)
MHQLQLVYRSDMDVKAPDVLALAGHGLRWRLLSELVRSDRQVRELTDLVGQPQSLVSYHLGRLRAGGLVATRRSSADRRETYYRIDLLRCGELLTDAAAALHPGLRPAPPPPTPRVPPAASVLFLCTGNSARSQIAEALFRHHGGDTVEVFSAGSHPKRLHPDAVRVMRERFGIDIAGQRVKHLSDFTGRRFDHVVSLCDRLREVCPEFPGAPEPIHWSIPDPAAEDDGYPAFERTAAELDTRVRFFIHHIARKD